MSTVLSNLSHLHERGEDTIRTTRQETTVLHLPMPTLTEKDLERWGAIPRSTNVLGCIVFDTHQRGNGYRLFSVNRRDGSNQHRLYQAHRLAYWIAYGVDPGDDTIEHLCANKACVNVAHLEPMSMRENVLAPTSKGMGALNARKTECPRGHAYDEENTLVRFDDKGRQSRTCRACKAERNKREAERDGRPYLSSEQRRQRAQERREAVEARKDKCRAGHDLNDPQIARTDVRKDGRVTRACRVCEKARRLAREAKQEQVAA